MNKLWTIFVILAVIIIGVISLYQFMNSLNGGNVTFNKQIVPIEDQMELDKLAYIKTLTPYLPVLDADLNNK